MVRAVLFDIGGVLEITPATGWQRAWCTALGIDHRELERRAGAIWADGEIGACSLVEVEHRTAEVFDLDAAQLQAFMDDLWDEYLGTLNVELAQFFAGLRNQVALRDETEIRTGILSNSFVGARERERAAYNFEAMCDIVVYSHEEGMKKPDHRFFILACERLGAEPGDVVFVDDAPGHVEAARSLGMQGVLHVTNAQTIGEIEAFLIG